MDDDIRDFVPPSRETPEDADWTTAILKELRDFVARLKGISTTAPTVSMEVLERGIHRLRELERRVESIEKAALLARTMCELAKEHLGTLSGRTVE